METMIKTGIEIKTPMSVPANRPGNFQNIYKILYDYQREDLQQIERFNGRAVLALPMGSGKTLEALAYMAKHPNLRPAIIIPPASVKLQWEKEINKWMPDEAVKVIEGKYMYLDGNDNNIIIINYDILAQYWELLEDLNPKLVIADEAHRLRGSGSQRTQCTKKLARTVPHILFMTGTPIYHRPIDIFPMLKMLGLSLSYYEFGLRFCGENDKENKFKGASNLDELHNLLANNFMIRRSEEEVKKDLPPKNNIIVPIHIDNVKEYQMAENDFINYLHQYENIDARKISGKAETLMKLNKLRKLAVEGKLKMVTDWLNDFRETEEKLVLFSYHHSTTDALYEKFKDISIQHDGRLSANKKEKVKIEFIENKNIYFFLGQLHASGEGVDGLQKVAHNCGFIEMDWGPKSHDQCMDRLQRKGIKEGVEKINIFWFIALGTIEEKMAEIMDKKRKVIDAAVDGTITPQESMVTELINYYRKRGKR